MEKTTRAITFDGQMMQRALALARRGFWRVSPNPMVGAVIVKAGRVIGEGYHRAYGKEHAEVAAILNASEDVQGACLYVNLEPCCHHGKTPPCTSTIISSKIGKVVIATLDPNPLVAGQGLRQLQAAGIQTAVGVLEWEARHCNERFFKFMERGIPFVTLKIAQSLDGRIATATGESSWITSLPSRRYVHRLRAANDAILVGRGTVSSDNPMLTCRLVKGRNPLRVVMDSRLAIADDAAVLQGQEAAKTLLVAQSAGANKERIASLTNRGIEVMLCPATAGALDIGHLLEDLGKRGVSSLLVEGGSRIATSFLKGGFVDRILAFVAPKIIGDGLSAFDDLRVRDITDCIGITWVTHRRIGEDIMLEGIPRNRRDSL